MREAGPMGVATVAAVKGAVVRAVVKVVEVRAGEVMAAGRVVVATAEAMEVVAKGAEAMVAETVAEVRAGAAREEATVVVTVVGARVVVVP